MQNPFEFIQEVRAEGSKVTWPTRRETLITTAMVFVFVIITSMFFFLTDQILRHLMSAVLGFLH
jgi:preprotein translocase subunit SecE